VLLQQAKRRARKQKAALAAEEAVVIAKPEEEEPAIEIVEDDRTDPLSSSDQSEAQAHVLPPFEHMATVAPEGEDAAQEEVAAPTSCLPFSFPRWRSYRHVKLSAERVQHYIAQYGGYCFAYVNLHNALYHYEVSPSSPTA
jgi:hypothetical protein